MSHYSLEELIARWKREELSVEQVIGQLLLLLRAHEDRMKELARAAGEAAREVGVVRNNGT